MDFLKRLLIDAANPGAYSGCSWENGGDRHTRLTAVNPAFGTDIADVFTADKADYDEVMTRLEQAFYAWRTVPAPQRGELIRKIGLALRQQKGALGSLIACEMGKSKQEGDGEVQEMIDMADFAVGQSRMLYGNTMHSERPHHRLYEQWHPYGIVGVISAFNFPVAVWAWNAFIAAICGNVTLWKPSSKTPLSAIAVHRICSQVLREENCPDIFGLIIPESRQLASHLLTDERIALLSFTGSTKVGKQVATTVAGRLGRTILELGGNNAIIVDETADLTLAIPAIVFGSIGTAGQRCTSTRRLIVHESQYDEVVSRLQKAYAQIRIGDPLDTTNLMGPLIDKAAVTVYEETIQSIKKQGGQIAFGGNRIDRPGYFVEPTLVVGLPTHSDILQKEVFAPILYVMPYKCFKDAVKLQNGVSQGLSSALFSQQIKHIEYFLSVEGSDCGLANINSGTSGAEIGGAFGGEKETGGGRESGSDAWKAYMRRQTNTINWGDALPLAQGIEFDLDNDRE